MKRIIVAAALIRASENHPEYPKILMSRRKSGVHLAGFWEFPGGKVESLENPKDALSRELKEELDIEIENPQIYAVGHHVYEEKEVILLVYDCTLKSGTPKALEVAEFAWLTIEEVIALDLPPADIDVVIRLKQELTNGRG